MTEKEIRTHLQGGDSRYHPPWENGASCADLEVWDKGSYSTLAVV